MIQENSMEAIINRFEMNQSSDPEDICKVCLYEDQGLEYFPCAACTMNPDNEEGQQP